VLKSILIANRGEIAVRVARSCREMGIRVIAVYSTEDRDAEVVRLADDAVLIGPGPAKRSYLYAPALLEAARRTGAEAIHPGYGFLSEDPDFAAACEAEGVTFIGPPSEVIARLGDKTEARTMLSAAGLPLLPGSLDSIDDLETAHRIADDIGYPVIVKAAMGGGGRGLSVVRESADFPRAFRKARADSRALFGDGRVYVERYLQNGRHVEVQVLCDGAGRVLHLGERDCSLQRRHQKLVEETPAPRLSPATVARMRDAAVRGASAAGYVGAGTFEFIVDSDGEFYFLEVNCRIQVEHCVTEMTTGVDLVAEQIRVASGEPLTLSQRDIMPRGVAIECRINAEDPYRGFAPAPGTLTEFVPPAGPFVRVDTFVRTGSRISPAYDSLIAKLIVWAPDRERAIARMRRALAEFRITGRGVATTAGFLGELLDHPVYRGGTHDTGFVEKMLAATPPSR
jgi:acetyl-CoA carboxylase biotin carboxylase subunit